MLVERAKHLAVRRKNWNFLTVSRHVSFSHASVDHEFRHTIVKVAEAIVEWIRQVLFVTVCLFTMKGSQ